MALENVTTGQLIKNKPEDLLLMELNDLRQKNLTADRVGKLKRCSESFCGFYISLAYSFFGLSEKQIREMSIEKRIILGNIIFQRARPYAIIQTVLIPILTCIPIFGWIALGVMFGDEEAHSFYYFRRMRQLRSMSTDSDYFPNETLEKFLSKNS